jgi:selenocysteine lyase/cysteine desulfurase
MVSVLNDFAKMVPNDSMDHWQDGTINYLSFRAIINGLAFLSSIGMDNIYKHVQVCTEYATQRLMGKL